MALPNLAASSDLSARGVDVTNAALVAVMLAVASATIRNAAQSPILSTSSTVTVWALDECDPWLDLPGKPVTAVSSVTLDGTLLAATDYKLVDGRLWRRGGWWGGPRYSEPIAAVIALTHGFAATPVDIINLVCDLAEAGIKTANTGGISDPRVLVESIDDYSVTYRQGGQVVASVMELPAMTRDGLRKRFGGGVGLVTSR